MLVGSSSEMGPMMLNDSPELAAGTGRVVVKGEIFGQHSLADDRTTLMDA
jgi:hypothetical protein